MMPCIIAVVGYTCVSENGTARSPKTLVSYCNTIWHHNPEDHDLNDMNEDNLNSVSCDTSMWITMMKPEILQLWS
jgi:hypothetical protein